MAEPDRTHWVYIENEGALFRGPSRAWPMEVWGPKSRTWRPYAGAGPDPKPISWGTEISSTEAQDFMMAD